MNYQATTQPVFSGCIKYKGKYFAYTQQGTKLNVSESDCRRLIDNGDRPFNYFAENKNLQQQQPEKLSNTQQNTEQKMTPQQYIKYLQYLEDNNQANNVIQETQTLTYSRDIHHIN